MSRKFDVSIIRDQTEEAMAKMNYAGLCMKRFHADITMQKKEFDSLVVNELITVGNRKLKIVQLGKRCFDSCSLYVAGGYCPLKKNCAFGMWVE
jgi:hypothetical protein